MSATFHIERRLEFRDTDAAGIAHFSAFFFFMEQTEHEFLRSLGLSVMASDAQGPTGWPRVSAQCDFQDAVRFEDVLDIGLEIARLGEKSITYEFRFTHRGRPIAHGKLTTVCCRVENGQVHSIPIPDSFRRKLEGWQAASTG